MIKEKIRRYWYWMALVVILLLAAIERFQNITEVGVYGSDVFFYWNTAKAWALGKLSLTEHYRPVTYLLFSTAMKIWGINDYSIKIFNSLTDLVNIGLIFWISRRILKNNLYAVLISLIYSFTYYAIEQSRDELVHLISTTAILTSFLSFHYFFETIKTKLFRKYIYLFLSGLGVGAAANMHPELGVCAIVYMFFIGWMVMTKFRNEKNYRSFMLSAFYKYQGVFILGCAAIFLVVIAKFGLSATLESISHGKKAQSNYGDINILNAFFRAATLFFTSNTSKFLMWVFYSTFGILAWRKFKRKKEPMWVYTLVALFMFYITCYVILVPRHMITRLFVPFIPLVYIYIFYWYNLILKKYAKVIFPILSLIILWGNRYYSSVISYTATTKPTLVKDIYNVIGDRVNKDNRLLVAPIILYSDRTPFTQQVYFGSNAGYLQHYKRYTFERLMKEQNFRYLFVSSVGYDTRMLGTKGINQFVEMFYKMSPKDYSTDKEKVLLKEVVEKLGGKLIHQLPVGKIYELPKL